MGLQGEITHNLIAKKIKKNNNLSYCSNDDESMGAKKRNSISGNTSGVDVGKTKMRTINSASSIKAIQSMQRKSSNQSKYNMVQNVKRYDLKDQASNIIPEIQPKVMMNEESLNEVSGSYQFQGQLPKDINDTLSSLYSTIEENSVCNKRHDISVVEADAILDQINSRMIKLHFEMIYKNLDKVDNKNDDFSFEIDNMNNMIVPKNSSLPTKNKKFVQLPQRVDLYKENELSNGQLQWIEDRQTIRIFSQSPPRNENASISSPFTSPQTNPRSPNGSVMSPNSTRHCGSCRSTKPSKRVMNQYHKPSTHYYQNSIIVDHRKMHNAEQMMVEINDHDDKEKDKNDDIEIELEYSQNFINLHDNSQVEKSFESRISEGAKSIDTNNYSFMTGMSQFDKQGKEKRFIRFVGEKIHVLEEECVRLYPSLNVQSHLKLYKPSFFSIAYQYPKAPELERFEFIA